MTGDIRVEPCACGGELRIAIAELESPDRIRDAVAYHQSADREHRLWRRRELAIQRGGRPLRSGLLVDVVEAAAARPVL